MIYNLLENNGIHPSSITLWIILFFFIIIWIVLTIVKQKVNPNANKKTNLNYFDYFKNKIKARSKMKTYNNANENANDNAYYLDSDVLNYFDSEVKSGCLGSSKKYEKGVYTDQEYDNILLKAINENASRANAMRELGIDESQVSEVAPICFRGYEQENGAECRYGLDGRFRTSQYSVTWLFFSDSQIFVFYTFIDLLYHKTKIVTNEYFYKDITNFSSITSTYEYMKIIPKKGCLSKGNDVEIKKVKNQKFSIIVPGDSFYCSVSGVSNINETIQGLKQKLREKKELNA